MRRALAIPAILLLCAFGGRGSQYAVYGDNHVYGPVGSYSAYNGPFCASGFKRGVDYTQSLAIQPSLFPNSTVISWSFPNSGPTAPGCSGPGIWGYDHEDFGNYDGGSQDITAEKISAITALKPTFLWSITGTAANFDVLDDTFLWDTPTQTTQLNEVEIFLHSPTAVQNFVNGATQIGTHTDSCGTSWKVAHSGTDMLFAPVGYADFSSGCVDKLDLLNYLVAQGQISASEYYTGNGLGVEIYQGSGSFSIASLSVAYTHS